MKHDEAARGAGAFCLLRDDRCAAIGQDKHGRVVECAATTPAGHGSIPSRRSHALAEPHACVFAFLRQESQAEHAVPDEVAVKRAVSAVL